MKILFQGRYFWMRSLGATCLGDFTSILIVVLLAFMPVVPFFIVPKLIFSMYVYRVIYAIFAVTPATLIARILKRKENIDVYDYNTNFNPLAFKA